MEYVPVGGKVTYHSFVSDTGGCGAVRIINPSFLVSNYCSPYNSYEATWSTQFIKDERFYDNYTFTIFQRPVHDDHWKWIRWFNDNIKMYQQVPCVADIDDLYLDIPPYNYASQFFSQYIDRAIEIMTMVHGVSASTEILAASLRPYNNNVVVTPNRLGRYLWGEPEFCVKDKNKKLKIVYPCSANHFPTISLWQQGIRGGDVGPELMKYIRDTVDRFEWTFIGHFPQELSDLVKDKKIQLPNWRAAYLYPAFLKGLNADIGIAPLDQNRFNECKSNIKMLEFVAAGIPGVYTDIEPYHQASMKAPYEDGFIQKIEQLASDENLRYETWRIDHEAVRQELFYEENDNLYKHINTYLSLFDRQLIDSEYKAEQKYQYSIYYQSNMEHMKDFISSVVCKGDTVVYINMKGTNIAESVLKKEIKQLYIYDSTIPSGIELVRDYAKGIPLRLSVIEHASDVVYPSDIMIIDCLELSNDFIEDIVYNNFETINRSVMFVNTEYGNNGIIVDKMMDTQRLGFKKVHDSHLAGGVKIFYKETEMISVPYLGDAKLDASHSVLEVIHPGREDLGHAVEIQSTE